MSMLCPECRGPLVTHDGVNATCTVHGGQYRILYSRDGTPTATQVPAIPTVPAQAAEYGISSGNPMARSGYAPAAGYVSPAAVMCMVHQSVPAVTNCTKCRAPVCDTCMFALPGGVYLCAASPSAPPEIMTPRRKRTLAWAYGLAIWDTVAIAVLFSGALAGFARNKEDAAAFGLLVMALVFAPCIAGVAVGWSALDKRLGNNGWVWGATIWNSVIGAVLLLRIIMVHMQ